MATENPVSIKSKVAKITKFSEPLLTPVKATRASMVPKPEHKIDIFARPLSEVEVRVLVIKQFINIHHYFLTFTFCTDKNIKCL